jgi:hypothetical protein
MYIPLLCSQIPPVSGWFQYISRGGKTQRLRFTRVEIVLYYSKAKGKSYLPSHTGSAMQVLSEY